MRKLQYFGLCILCHTLLSGCDDYNLHGYSKPSTEYMYFNVDGQSFIFSSSGYSYSQEGYIQASGSWSFVDVPEWITVDPTSGAGRSDFFLTAEPNTSTTDRTAIFYVESKGKDLTLRRSITVEQGGEVPFIKFSEEAKTLSYKAQTISIPIETNIEDDSKFKTSVTCTWATASYSNKQLNISVEANTSTTSRDARIYINNDSPYESEYIKITQLPPNVEIDDISYIEFTAGGSCSETGQSYYPIQINSEIPWHASTDASWIFITPSSGEGETEETATITVLPSNQSTSRSAYVRFYTDNKSSAIRTIQITQKGRYLNVTPRSITLSADGVANKGISIDSDIDWEVQSAPTWISLSPNQGQGGNSTVSATASKNNSLNSRSGDIVICDSKGLGLKQTVSVTQSPIDFGDISVIEFNWQASSHALKLPFPNYWNATVSNGWITLSEYQGTGESEINVSVSRNDSDNARTGEIIFTTEDQTFKVNIIQSGQYLHLNSESGNFSAMGGSSELSVSTSINTKWSISYPTDNTDWITVDDSKANTYLFSVSYNPSMNAREAEFILHVTEDEVAEIYKQGVKYHISQSGRALTCDVYQLDMFDAGGTSDTYSISSDGAYTITKDDADTWYTIVHNASLNTFYIVVTENVSTDSRSGKIKIALSDLPAGEEFIHEIAIHQYGQGFNFKFDDFDDEEIW